MLTQRFVAGIFAVGMLVLGAGPVSGQNYPNKTIRIVTAAPGGSIDFTARLVAQGLAGPYDCCPSVVAGKVRQGVGRFGQSQAGRA